MKKLANIFKTRPAIKVAAILAFALIQAPAVIAQEGDSATVTTDKKEKDKRPVKDVFESGYIINNQTAVLPTAKTLEFIIQHRFGLLNSDEFDLGGLYAPSNIRIGFNYTLNDRIQLGIGTTKNNKLQDITWKFAILKQTRSGSIPLCITYFGDAAIDVRKDLYPAVTNRLSYFHQLIFARKFSKRLSLQVAPSISHFNMVDSLVKHDNIALSFAGRIKVTDALAVIFEYDHLFTAQNDVLPAVKPNVGLGIEASTSSHVFQVFVSTGQAIINQHHILYNRNDFTKMDVCIGFNMTRLWNY